MSRIITAILACSALALLAPGCGSSTKSSSGSTTGASTHTGETGAGALSAEATSAATGDIPDSQVFLTYSNPAGGYALSYPEGWTIKAQGADVTISEKNNLVRVVIERAPPPTVSSIGAELTRLKRSDPTLTFSAPSVTALRSGSAVMATYTTRSAPNPVTGKSVVLIVDRYQLSKGGELATVDLGTAKGVDNVDAYRKMINSFRWQ
jgi:hypothetical protein